LRILGKVVCEFLELRPRPRLIDPVETLRELLEREAALDYMSAQDSDGLLAFRIGRSQGGGSVAHEWSIVDSG